MRECTQVVKLEGFVENDARDRGRAPATQGLRRGYGEGHAIPPRAAVNALGLAAREGAVPRL